MVFLRAPRRIVSLVPSETETLFALGVGDRIVGRTRYCVEPAGRVDSIPVCGGTKDIDVAAVAELRPDLILANQEENARAPLETLAQSGHQLYVSFPRRVADGLAHLARLARILEIAGESRARDLIRRSHEAVSRAEKTRVTEPLRVFVPIWMDPLMTISGDTFASDMLGLVGADNVFADRQRFYPLAADLGTREPDPDPGTRDIRYPRITRDEIIARAPEAVLLPDEPHPFTEADAEVFRVLPIPAAERGAIRMIDGKDLFWHGARSVDAIGRLRAVVGELRDLCRAGSTSGPNRPVR